MMVRKDEIDTLIESKFDVLKNAFVNETKELFTKEMKDEMKKLFPEEFEKIKNNSLLKPTKRRKSQLQRCLGSMLKTWSVQMRNSKKNGKNMNNTVDVYV